MAAYNEERWIGEALGSLMRQTHPSYEVVVVDDGSRDGTADVAGRFPVRLLRTSHEGAGAARDVGGRAARGNVLVFSDADDVYAPDFLERLVAPFDTPDVRGTFPTPIEWLNANDGLAPGWLHVRMGAPDLPPEAFGEIAPYCKAVRRSVFEEVGGYPRSGYGEDEVFGLQVGPAFVVRDALWYVSLPSGVLEIFRKARWIGRGTRFDRERPPLWTMLPPPSLARALWQLVRGRPRTAAVRVLYDAGLLLGYVDRRLERFPDKAP